MQHEHLDERLVDARQDLSDQIQGGPAIVEGRLAVLDDVQVLFQLPARPRPLRGLGHVKGRADQEGALLPHLDVRQALRGDQEHLLRGVGGDVRGQAAAAKHPPDHAPVGLEHLRQASVVGRER